MSDIEDVLRDAGYQIVPVPRPTRGVGCSDCGRADVEVLNGVCIVCAAKHAPIRPTDRPEPTTEEPTDGTD